MFNFLKRKKIETIPNPNKEIPIVWHTAIFHMSTNEFIIAKAPFIGNNLYQLEKSSSIEIHLPYNLYMICNGDNTTVELQEWNPFSNDLIQFINVKDIIAITHPDERITNTYHKLINNVLNTTIKNDNELNDDNDEAESIYKEPYWILRNV